MAFVLPDGLFMSVDCHFLAIGACTVGTVSWLIGYNFKETFQVAPVYVEVSNKASSKESLYSSDSWAWNYRRDKF